MPCTFISRRSLLVAGAAGAAAGLAAGAEAPRARPAGEPFGYCLNTSTVRGHRLDLVKEVELAAKAGYGAIEPWVGSVRRFQQGGGSLNDLRKKIADLGLAVPSAIGFCRWIAADATQRQKALEQGKADMELLLQIGGTGIAAPPAGARRPLDLLAAAERYGALLDVGKEIGIVPQLELWGPSALHRIGQAVLIAIESGRPNARLLLDIYHIYKGGSSFAGLAMLGPKAMNVFHVNDYPADPPRETIRDSHRVFPGDGVAPTKSILRTLRDIGFRGWLSLELFNNEYYKRPAAEVAKTGLEKMKAAVRAALA